MNPSPPSGPDPLLGAWKIDPPPNPRFRPDVWARIEALGPTWPAYLRRHGASIGLAAVALVAASGWIGHTVANARDQAAREAMVVNYLVDLDPRVQATLPHPGR